eukprot:TRINITY_DN1113_c0_g1_i2.p1 TRINITY_DN1113_c0_g1~~TRINITY_DN1113_c0_g1_i2.p1  ORF type:complete len:115 (-),score=26.64 TRINITY_DN1113_c0_g1_i2:298-642(-)
MSVQQLTALELQEYFLRLAGHAEPKKRDEEQEEHMLQKVAESKDKFFDSVPQHRQRHTQVVIEQEVTDEETGETFLGRWAGGAFENTPAPSTLPIPSFVQSTSKSSVIRQAVVN